MAAMTATQLAQKYNVPEPVVTQVIDKFNDAHARNDLLKAVQAGNARGFFRGLFPEFQSLANGDTWNKIGAVVSLVIKAFGVAMGVYEGGKWLELWNAGS